MAEAAPFAAIWDMDGTLVDTAELHFRAWERLCRDLGRTFTRADFAATFGQRNPEIIPFLFGDRFDSAQIKELGEQKELYYREATRQHGVTLLPGVATLLQTLADQGIPQAVGSSAPRENLDLLLELAGARAYFTALVGMEDTTRGKPDPQVFQIAAERLNVAPERCIVFEDAIAGVRAARAAGMKCIAITFVGHHPAEQLHEAGADRVVDTLEQITWSELTDLLTGI